MWTFLAICGSVLGLIETVGSVIGSVKSNNLAKEINELQAKLKSKQISLDSATHKLNSILTFLSQAAPSSSSKVRELQKELIINAQRGVESALRDYNDTSKTIEEQINKKQTDANKYSGTGTASIVHAVADAVNNYPTSNPVEDAIKNQNANGLETKFKGENKDVSKISKQRA